MRITKKLNFNNITLICGILIWLGITICLSMSDFSVFVNILWSAFFAILTILWPLALR